MKRLLGSTFLVLFLISGGNALAADLIAELTALSKYPGFAKRVGLESEFAGLTQQQVTEILQRRLLGQAHTELDDYVYREGGQTRHHKTVIVLIEDTRIGFIEIKQEDNSVTLTELAQRTEATGFLEVVTRPLDLAGLGLFQQAVDLFKASGAQGTTPSRAVADQVNVEMGGGKKENITPRMIANILCNYYSPQNRREISAYLNVPPIRQSYLGYPPKGFLTRICNPSYSPNWEEFYMDSMYRASLEALHVADAWTMSDDQARRRLREIVEASDFQVLLPALKWNFVRYSSLLMEMRPEDWLTKYLASTRWFKPGLYLEFREPNSQFKIYDTALWILGLVYASETFGTWNGDLLETYRINGLMPCKLFLRQPEQLVLIP